MIDGTKSIYDCGCVKTRPKEQSCKTYGTRWRAYITTRHLILRCRDCARVHEFELLKHSVERTNYIFNKKQGDEKI